MKLTRMISNTNLKKEITQTIKYLKDYELYIDIMSVDDTVNLDVVIKNNSNNCYTDQYESFSIIEEDLEDNEENKKILEKEAKKLITYLNKHFSWCLDREIKYTTV